MLLKKTVCGVTSNSFKLRMLFNLEGSAWSVVEENVSVFGVAERLGIACKCFSVAGVVLLESFVTWKSWPSIARTSADGLSSYQAKFVTCQVVLRGTSVLPSSINTSDFPVPQIFWPYARPNQLYASDSIDPVEHFDLGELGITPCACCWLRVRLYSLLLAQLEYNISQFHMSEGYY